LTNVDSIKDLSDDVDNLIRKLIVWEGDDEECAKLIYLAGWSLGGAICM